MLRDLSTNFSAGATSISLSRPAETVPGDFLFAAICLGGHPAITKPADWSLGADQSNGSFMGLYCYYKWADVADPASWSFTWAGSEPAAAGIIAYQIGVSGFDATNLITNATSTTVTATSMPALKGQLLAIALFGSVANGAFSEAAGMTERVDVSSGAGACLAVDDMILLQNANTGTKTSTTTSGRNGGYFMTFRLTNTGWRQWRKTSDSTLWWAKQAPGDCWFDDDTSITATGTDWLITADPLPDPPPNTPGSVSVITNANLIANYTEV